MNSFKGISFRFIPNTLGHSLLSTSNTKCTQALSGLRQVGPTLWGATLGPTSADARHVPTLQGFRAVSFRFGASKHGGLLNGHQQIDENFCRGHAATPVCCGLYTDHVPFFCRSVVSNASPFTSQNGQCHRAPYPSGPICFESCPSVGKGLSMATPGVWWGCK